MKIKNLSLSLVSLLAVVAMLLPPAPALAAPLPPGNLGATVQAGPPLAVALTWSDNSTNEVGFRVKRAVAPGATFTDLTAAINGLPANSVSFTDTTVTAGITYSYQVVAFDLGGESPPF